jgi:hypothetical protein
MIRRRCGTISPGALPNTGPRPRPAARAKCGACGSAEAARGVKKAESGEPRENLTGRWQRGGRRNGE